MTPASNSSQQTPDAFASISFSASAPKMETTFDPRSAANFLIAGEFTAAVNAFVRWRDQGKLCFVCQAVVLRLGGVGGGFDAGHIRARSQADHLRFDPRNVHGQCKHCNAPGSTKDHEMRAAAERLLGKEVADALYADNRVIKWTRDGLRLIRDEYRAKLKALKATA